MEGGWGGLGGGGGGGGVVMFKHEMHAGPALTGEGHPLNALVMMTGKRKGRQWVSSQYLDLKREEG